ncbi:MAG: cytochrome b N-terminal domain-containing protein [Solirubrobacterales bacterium]
MPSKPKLPNPLKTPVAKLPKPPGALLPPMLRKSPTPGETSDHTVGSAAVEGGTSVVAWIDERTSGSGFLRGFMFRKVPKGTNWWYTLGSATMFAFISQALTGVFLAMYYEPDPIRAYDSVRYINNELFLGEFVHGMHKWGATVMTVLLFVHMGRTFVFGAYKYPRELNWVVGVLLLLMTMMMGFTGYLLPFDQRSYWASIVGINLNGTGPIIGPYLADFLRGGAEFGGTTLARFYAIHMMLVPGLIGALIGAHLYLVAKLGTSAPPWVKPKPPKSGQERI